jgi:antitoxin PrlF
MLMSNVKTYLLVGIYGYIMTGQEQIEDIIKVSSKGQIVIPREVRKKLGMKAGEKLLVLTRDGEIVLRKTQELTMDDIARRISKTVQEEHIDLDKLVAEAVEWARKSK